MRNIAVVAEQTRLVRQAQRQFLELWASERETILPALDRLQEDMDKQHELESREKLLDFLMGGDDQDDN